jgi:hypothetical protein
MRSHEWIDQRSLALDRLIADKLADQPELLQRAVQTLERWIAQRQPHPPAVLLEWRQILRERSLTDVLTLLRSDWTLAELTGGWLAFSGAFNQFSISHLV